MGNVQTDRPVDLGRRLRNWGFVIFLVLLSLLVVERWLFWDLPSIDDLGANLVQPSIRILDQKGRLLYELIPPGGGRHADLSLESIPQDLKDATVAVEDKTFYQNPGVDPQGILRAFWLNFREGDTTAGGSTLTQQVARNLLLDPEERTERTYRRKLREARLAWQLTRNYTKDEILQLYLNQINYGGVTFGVDAAAHTYFGKPARELTLAECALLAGLPQAPGLYNPYTRPDLAKKRQETVLNLMERNGYITAEENVRARADVLVYNPTPYPIEAPHFVWIVKSQLDGMFRDGALDINQSLVVRTTLDLDVQRVVEAAITRQLENFKPRPGKLDKNVNNAAVVVMDPRDGGLLALAGSADYFDPSIFGAVDMTTSPRQTGSAFKPIIYAAAMDPLGPEPWTAGASILDVSLTFSTHNGMPYTPVNYDQLEHGPVLVREALGSSLNVPAVAALEHTGIERVVTLADRLGISTLENAADYDLSLALGGGQVSLLELTTAYSVFANRGFYNGYSAILEIHDADGSLLYTQMPGPQTQVLDERIAWLISDILSDDQARTLGFGPDSTLKLDRTAAVKTGTTTNFHDNWTIGYTPELLVGVWVGNSNHEAMHTVTGLTGAAPIWNEIMRACLRGQPDKEFERPDGLVQVEICTFSGLLPSEACPHKTREWFLAGTEPIERDTVFQEVRYDARTGLLDDGTIPEHRLATAVVLDLPVQAQAWARDQGLPLLEDYTFGEAGNPDSTPELVMVSPRSNTTYRIDPDYAPSSQQLKVEAIGVPALIEVSLWADGTRLVVLAGPPYQAWWQLEPGEHRFWAEGVDSEGQIVESNVITVTVVE
ncbi:MAG: penicillin-binding protein 1C [Anaerolineales bacterium]|nr:penicillin-binding protein 1C [Anaerolineales bacterium]